MDAAFDGNPPTSRRRGLRAPHVGRPRDPRWLRHLRTLALPESGEDPGVENFAALAGLSDGDVVETEESVGTEGVELEGMSDDVAKRWLGQVGGYRGTVKYENLWFCWHALARVKRNWRRFAWWSTDYMRPLTEEQAEALRRREAVQKNLGRLFAEKFGDLEVGPGAWFPAPTAEGACPAKHHRRELELLMLLGHYIRVPVRLKLHRPIHTGDDPPVPVGVQVLAYVDLEAADAELREEIAQIRRARGVVQGPHAKTWRVWGGTTVTAAHAIALVDHVVGGGSIQSFAETWVAGHGGQPDNARKTFSELGEDLHHVFHREPLASLRGTWRLPSREARRRRSARK